MLHYFEILCFVGLVLQKRFPSRGKCSDHWPKNCLVEDVLSERDKCAPPTPDPFLYFFPIDSCHFLDWILQSTCSEMLDSFFLVSPQPWHLSSPHPSTSTLVHMSGWPAPLVSEGRGFIQDHSPIPTKNLQNLSKCTKTHANNNGCHKWSKPSFLGIKHEPNISLILIETL